MTNGAALGSGGGGADGGLAGVKVVVIDDSSTICRAARAILGRAGCSVVTATDGFAALSEIIEHHPRLILVDSLMPRLDGYQTCAVIRRNPEFRHIPVVLLINLDHHLDRVRGGMLGINGYLTKPFTGAELLDTVRRHI